MHTLTYKHIQTHIHTHIYSSTHTCSYTNKHINKQTLINTPLKVDKPIYELCETPLPWHTPNSWWWSHGTQLYDIAWVWSNAQNPGKRYTLFFGWGRDIYDRIHIHTYLYMLGLWLWLLLWLQLLLWFLLLIYFLFIYIYIYRYLMVVIVKIITSVIVMIIADTFSHINQTVVKRYQISYYY